jgi:splicing factor 3B subunit 3
MPPKAGASSTEEAVPVQAVAMKLMDVRLKPASAIIASVSGEFTAPGRHEIVFLRVGGTLEVQRIVQTDEEDKDEDPRTFLKLITRVETRSILRSCSVIRFTGEKRDVLAVGADGGALSILDFENGVCKIIHCVTFGKIGCRRSTPGQYLAADPKGRAVMVSAVEKRKLVYVLNRDATGKPTIASPLEAHRTRTITFDTVALDNGYDNPIFATLELQYPDTEDSSPEPLDELEKQLAYYELDLGLNHVSRRWATTTHRTACCLAAIPGGADGPGGVLVGGEDWIEYLHETIGKQDDDDTMDAGKKFHKVICAIPRRKIHPKEKGILITQITLHRQKKSKFFALAQSELGDVYKVTLEMDPADKTKVSGMEVALLDTLPAANSLNVSKLGMLFVAAEFGDHNLYQFERIDLPDAPTSSSEACQKAYLESGSKSEAGFLTTANATKMAPTFDPTLLKNLRKIYTMDNPSPTTGIMVGELAGNEVSPQIYTLTGTGPHSAIRILRHGASVTELAVSDLPGIPGGIFTIADNSQEATASAVRNDKYIVVSFADATLVLSVGETVEEVGKESGFLTNAPTLACSALGNDGAVCQVHPSGVRQIQRGQAKQWNCSGLKRIECASANESQVVIALAGGEVTYFELDPMSGNLMEKKSRDMGADVCCLDVGTIPNGRSRSLFAVVGCRDQTVRIVSLEPGNLLVQRSSTALKSRPHSVSLQMMTSSDSSGNEDLTLVIGLDDGSSLRASVDPVTGGIGTSPTRRFLGARPVSVSRISLESNSAALLLSSRPWISRRDGASGKHIMAPLSYAPLDHGCSFSSDAVREGVVATAGKTLRILSVDAVGVDGGDDEAFNTNKVELRYTPRQMTLMSTTTGASADERKVVLAVVESDYNDYGMEETKGMGFDPTGEGKSGKKGAIKGEDDAMDMDEDSDDEGVKKEKEAEKEGDDEEDAEEKEVRKTPIRGPVPPGPGHWGSCIRLLDPSDSCVTLDCVEMGRNEAALCCTSVRFHSKGGEQLLAVGTVTGMTLHPLKQSASHIVLYRIINGDRFQLLHRTTVDDGPVLALAHFQGRLLVGIGKTLRLYEMGKRQLLRKCELRGLPTYVKALQTVGDRAFVGDMMQSISIVKYDAASNILGLIASDPSPRPIVCQELLDMNTVAVGDKFGNISVLRLPRSADTGVMESTGQRALWDATRDDATPRLELLCQYYVGEVVTSMTRSSLVAGGAESLIYVTVSGRIGSLVPFTSREDVEFFSQLEASLRTDALRPTGRDPQAYRSYYAPIIHVVDGELCDAFNSLSHDEQNKIAEKLDRTIGEIMKKLEDTRNSLL